MLDINISIDFDAEEVHIIVDNSITIYASADDDGVKFHNFHKIDDENLADLLKQYCRLAFNLTY